MKLRTLIYAAAASALLAVSSMALPEAQTVPSVAHERTDTYRASSHALSAAELEVWLDGFMSSRLERNDVAGAMIVVVQNGSILFKKGYGYADMARRRRFDPDTTLVRPGSVSKLMTWTAVMQQVEQGHIDLDRDVNAYLDFRIPPFNGQPVTMRNLMTHTAGFQESLKDLLLFDPKGRMPLGVFLKNQIPPRIYPPGTTPSYSNYGAALAGYIVQRVSGQPFETYIEHNIFGPLGMRQSSFRQPLPTDMRSEMSQGYITASAPPARYEMLPAPAGSAATTGADMAKFMIAHLGDGEYRGQRILRPDTARTIHNSPLTTISPRLNRMLLGFWESNRNGRRIIGHDGDTLYFHSAFRLLPDENVGLFILVNSIGKDSGGRKIRDDLFANLIDRYFPGPTVTGSLPKNIARHDGQLLAGSYSGTYMSAPRWKIGYASLLDLGTQTVVTTDTAGRVSASTIFGANGKPKIFEEVAPYIWREVGGKSLIVAKVVNGKVAMWGDDENAPIGVYLPTPASRDATWLVPMLALALASLFALALLWPVSSLVRRRYDARLALANKAAQARRWAYIAAVSACAVMLGWLGTLGWIVSTFSFISALDPWILVLHVFSILVFPAAAAMTLRNAWIVFSTRKGVRHVADWAWSGLIAASCLILLYTALTFDLVGFSLTL